MLGELSIQEIEDVLKSNALGRIGCSSSQAVYVVPVTYAYDGESIIGCTVEGLKVDMLRKNPECCFEVDSAKDLSNWVSVIAWGTFEELGGDAATRATEFFLKTVERFMPHDSSQPARMGPSSSGRQATFVNTNPIIYRIKLREKTGRFERT
jgi:nitroimidazol reductase NimA-like FMN-containing flavoprotein (pyridoxamine 5'-phosphate oxidase superfamily)